MRTFIFLWLGQLASSVGSSMTYFALNLWVWQQTQSATAIALILVFYQLPQIAISPLSGLLADRVSRKRLLILSDTASACCTVAVGILAALQILQLWHVYLIAAVVGSFGNIQALTYSTLIPLIVPKQHHTRASSMGTMVGYGANIFSPALAGLLYPQIGLLGITLIDMSTFAIAMLTLLITPIPAIVNRYQDTQKQQFTLQTTPQKIENVEETKRNIWHEVTFGFRYIASQPSLLAMVVAMSVFAFLHQVSETLCQPMILARTGGDTQILGLVVAVSGLGGVVGAIALSIWGGFRRRLAGILAGFIGTGFSYLMLGLGRLSGLWATARFGSSFHNPLVMSSYMAVWYAKVAPKYQGRVFAADYLVGIVIESTAGLSAGLLADRILEPALQSGGWLAVYLGGWIGTGPGSGMALLITMSAMGMVLIGIMGFTVRQLREAETLIVDHDSIGR
ncbi:major Facilitator superfamily [Rubidibacter lacunae KORDI 51-2]|uniref:Major Facilitator superfamily n=1 Tax=Rubidibacter lacunae KORDI 51-2 TaxID=582515 RepID=U5DPA4_9CHRO|nr:MFS transporter [Rubidibacter lacunae]ERN42439.1 major Facilitator superfamily [Rubidibacter lacunae KORDI 51-2]